MTLFKHLNGHALAAGIVLAASLVFASACGGGGASAAGPNQDFSGNNGPSIQERAGTTSAFGIPAGMEGNVASGETLFTNTCKGCHGSMGPRDFTQITGALANIGPMGSLNLSQQDVADITAYLNRASIPPPPAPPADPTPPPVDPTPPPATDPTPPSTGDSLTGFGIPAGMSGSISGGEQIWTNNCTGCHGSMGAKSFGQIESALNNVGAMSGFQLSQQEIADLTAYLNRNAGTGGNPGGTVGDDDDDDGDDDSMDGDDGDDDDGGQGVDDDDDDGDDSMDGDDDDDDNGNTDPGLNGGDDDDDEGGSSGDDDDDEGDDD